MFINFRQLLVQDRVVFASKNQSDRIFLNLEDVGFGSGKSQSSASLGSEITLEKVQTWIKDFHEQTDRWPHGQSPNVGLPEGKTWASVNKAVQKGLPNLEKCHDLTAFAVKYCGKPELQNLSYEIISGWVRQYFTNHKVWPNPNSGNDSLPEGETWSVINHALQNVTRGLPPGSMKFSEFLFEHCIDFDVIKSWVEKCHDEIGVYPTSHQIRRTGLPRGAFGWADLNRGLQARKYSGVPEECDSLKAFVETFYKKSSE